MMYVYIYNGCLNLCGYCNGLNTFLYQEQTKIVPQIGFTFIKCGFA